MSVLIKGMEMPNKKNGAVLIIYLNGECAFEDGKTYQAITVPKHGRLKKRVVYRGEVYSAIEAARINALDGILTDRYKDGYHDGLKRALEILANEVDDAPTIIPAEGEDS